MVGSLEQFPQQQFYDSVGRSADVGIDGRQIVFSHNPAADYLHGYALSTPYLFDGGKPGLTKLTYGFVTCEIASSSCVMIRGIRPTDGRYDPLIGLLVDSGVVVGEPRFNFFDKEEKKIIEATEKLLFDNWLKKAIDIEPTIDARILSDTEDQYLVLRCLEVIEGSGFRFESFGDPNPVLVSSSMATDTAGDILNLASEIATDPSWTINRGLDFAERLDDQVGKVFGSIIGF